MQINKTLTGNLEIKSIKKGPEGHRVMTLAFKTIIDAGDPEWDDRLMSIAFNPYDESGEHEPLGFGYQSLKPRLECEVHLIKLLGQKLRTTPEIATIKPVEGQPSVTVDILLPVEINKMYPNIIVELALACGDTVEIAFKSEQARLL